jgi:hypothetical protein|tara:strand:+ start:2095 stop:2376 length:282 start_codon:yes stop_codon:yes gene_type:complete
MRDKKDSWVRGKEVEVTHEWLKANRRFLPPNKFRIVEEEPTSAEESNVPDESWNRKDIVSWLKEAGVQMGSGYLTKPAALMLVEKHLNEGSLQ